MSSETSVVSSPPKETAVVSSPQKETAVSASSAPKEITAVSVCSAPKEEPVASSKKMIVLKTSDDESFEVEESVALQSQTIKHMIEDECADGEIPIPNVTGAIMAKIIEYCKRHVGAPDSSSYVSYDEKKAQEELKAFDTEFLKVEQNVLFDLILAANYLDIKGLLNLTCEAVANMMKGKTPEEIRKTFNIKNDYTPEEEEEIRKENAWAFE